MRATAATPSCCTGICASLRTPAYRFGTLRWAVRIAVATLFVMACSSQPAGLRIGAVDGDAGTFQDAHTAVCGDGIIEGNEVCDDGNTVSGDGCSADCLSDETCGNGIVDVTEGG